MNETSKARIQCSGCQAGFKVKAAAIGKKVKCPKCETVFVAAPVAARKAVPVAQEQTKSPSPQAVPAAKPVAPSGTKRCNMCHEFIPVDEFDAHYQQHEGLADDGQHNAYPTQRVSNTPARRAVDRRSKECASKLHSSGVRLCDCNARGDYSNLLGEPVFLRIQFFLLWV